MIVAGSTDADLVRATVRGDRSAYAQLVHKYASRIYAVCLSMLRDREDSQDVAQETLMRAMTRLDTLRDGSQFAMWITRMAQNLCRDQHRGRKRRRELLKERGGELGPLPEPPRPDLSSALERLPEKFRTPLMLYYFDGQSSENVAKALDISRAGASSRLARAREALRQLLEKSHE